MNTITQILIEILSTAVATALICLMKAGVDWIGTKCKSEKVQLALQEFQTVLEDGVGYIEQTLVRTAKESNTWNIASQKEALASCIEYIKENVTEKAWDILTEDKDDIEAWVEAKIEAYIQYQKN